jgi:ATP synthase protein I
MKNNINPAKKFIEKVCRKEELKIRSRAEGRYGALAWIGMLGIIGWSVTVPMLLGVALGLWIDRTFPGKYSFTVMLLVGGLALGCVNAWSWIKKHGINHNSENKDDKPAGEKK